MQRSEVYKTPRPHEEELPRPGDLAEVTRGHCRANAEAGLLVQVMNEPHLARVDCADCGAKVVEYIVEVHCDSPDWQKTPGPWFMPIRWLKRIDPTDPVQYARLKKREYVPTIATPEQLIAANR